MVVFQQVFILFFFILVGFCLSKLKLVSRDQAPLLSRLLVYVFSPCLTFKSFSTNFNLPNLAQKYPLIISGAILLIFVALGAFLLSGLMTKNKYTRSVYNYSLAMPNYGYIGYPLVQSLLGDAGLFSYMLFVLGASIYVNTIGFCTLTKQPFNLKGLLNMATIPMLLGMIFGLLQIPLPDVATDILTSGGNCVGPVSMLLAGIVISEFQISALIRDKIAYFISAMRLLIIPLAVGFVLKFLGLDELALYATLFYALPCGLNTIVFPKLVGEECEFGAKLALITNVLASLTIPLNMLLLGIS